MSPIHIKTSSPLQVHFHVNEIHFHIKGFAKTHFETKAQRNSEMAYYSYINRK